MSEKSMLWETQTAEGDGTIPFNQKDAGWFFGDFINLKKSTMGVLKDIDNELAVTGTSSPLAIDTGKAVVYHFRYWNDASKNIAITTPSNGDTGGRIVLRADWSANTVRAVAIYNDDGVSTLPALTQVYKDVWEIPVASFVVTTGGTIYKTVNKASTGTTDERVYLQTPTAGTFLIGEIDGDGTFSSETITIPAGFNHLKIVVAGQSGAAAVSEEVGLQFNGDSGSNYRNFLVDMAFSGSSGVTVDQNYSSSVAQTSAHIGRLPGTSAVSDANGYSEAMVPNITRDGVYKSMISSGYYRTDHTNESSSKRLIMCGMWLNAEAITSVTILDTAGANFPTGFKASVYGWR